MPDYRDLNDYTAQLGEGIDISNIPQVTGFRQKILDLVIIPGPSSVRVKFRTLYKAHAASVAVYRVVTGDFAKDTQYFAALRLCPPDTRRFDIYIVTGGMNRIDPDVAYWVQVSCRDQLGNTIVAGYISLERKMRTWKRNLTMYVDRIKVYDDADPRASGELFFQLKVWDALTRVAVQENSTGQFDASSGDTINFPFTVPLSPAMPWVRKPDQLILQGASNRYGVFLSGRDDDHKDFFNIFPSAGLTLIVGPPTDMPWEEYEEAKSTDTDDTATMFRFIDLPDRAGKSTTTYALSLSKGKLRFTAYIVVINEVIATVQPLRWALERGLEDRAFTVIEIDGSTTLAGQRTGGADRRRLVATHITSAPEGGLRITNSIGAEPLGMTRVEGEIDAVKVIAAGEEKPSLLLVQDRKIGLRLAEMHGTEEAPKIVWQKQTVPLRGKIFVQDLPPEAAVDRKKKKGRGGKLAPTGPGWGIFAVSAKGAPLRIHPDGSSEVIGPVTKAEPQYLLVQPSQAGWHVVLQDESGKWQATSVSAAKKAGNAVWIDLPRELGSISLIQPLPDGRAIYMGLDDKRNLGVWAPGQKEVRHFGVWENLLPDAPELPEEARAFDPAPETGAREMDA